jgi:hypothetical protein
MAEIQQPGSAGGEARGGRGLGQENVILRSLVGIIAAAVFATTFVLPADARAKKPKRPAAVQTRWTVAP